VTIITLTGFIQSPKKSPYTAISLALLIARTIPIMITLMALPLSKMAKGSSSARNCFIRVRLSPVIPFAGAHASDNCAEAVSIQSTSKGAKIASVTDSKNLAREYVANAQAKVGRDLGKPQTAVPSIDKKPAWAKAFQKHKDHCC